MESWPPMESWFHILKTELVHHTHYVSRNAARRDLSVYIKTYDNHQRLQPHSGPVLPSKPRFTPHNTASTFPGKYHASVTVFRR
ncbi:IS3 family transposase [Defluviicoccus vanus]|uniref:IS3 family transposase n=1 Tax=Defluviicoccus vanus TaxID=111831 RepID=A0A7H1N0M5_9PROT|nr:IS3 family transposase [Defluviicoccus vanus]